MGLKKKSAAAQAAAAEKEKEGEAEEKKQSPHVLRKLKARNQTRKLDEVRPHRHSPRLISCACVPSGQQMRPLWSYMLPCRACYTGSPVQFVADCEYISQCSRAGRAVCIHEVCGPADLRYHCPTNQHGHTSAS